MASDPTDFTEFSEILARHAQEEARAQAGGGRARQERQRRLGRMTARERVQALLDEGSALVEIGHHTRHAHAAMDPRLAASQPPGDGIICGVGQIDGRSVAVCAHDPTVHQGAVGEAGARKLCRLLELARAQALPLITLADSEGARIAEGVHAIAAWTEVMRLTTLHRQRAPHLTVALGLCVGATAYDAALGDWVGMVEDQSFMCVTGPSVTQAVTGEAIELSALGGAAMHAEVTGCSHATLPSEHEALAWARRVLAYTSQPTLPASDDPQRACEEVLERFPANARRAYNARKVLRPILDEGSWLELSRAYAPSVLTGLARLGGRSVAVVASQPQARMGCLDIDASRKIEPLLRYAQTHRLPVLTFVDTSGFMPGLAQERGGVLREGARLLRAYAELDVPTISVTLRKSYGGANVLASASQLRLAWPTAEIAPMGAEGAARVAFGPPREDGADEADRAAFRESWRQAHGDAWLAAERGFFDEVIHPAQTRAALWRALVALGGLT